MGVVSQQVRGVVCRHKLYRGRGFGCVVFVESAPELADGLFGFEQGSGGVGTEGNDDFGIYQFELFLKVGQAAYDLFRSRVSVAGGTAFENIADEDICSLKVASGDNVVEQFAGSANKGSALCVFVCAWSFANKYDPCVGVAFAGDGVGACLAKSALAAFSQLISDLFEFDSWIRCFSVTGARRTGL